MHRLMYALIMRYYNYLSHRCLNISAVKFCDNPLISVHYMYIRWYHVCSLGVIFELGSSSQSYHLWSICHSFTIQHFIKYIIYIYIVMVDTCGFVSMAYDELLVWFFSTKFILAFVSELPDTVMEIVTNIPLVKIELVMSPSYVLIHYMLF